MVQGIFTEDLTYTPVKTTALLYVYPAVNPEVKMLWTIIFIIRFSQRSAQDFMHDRMEHAMAYFLFTINTTGQVTLLAIYIYT